MKKIFTLTATVILLGSGASAFAQVTPPVPNNWGQEVKSCNQTACYPGETSRGAYVSQQAKDNQGPGYGYEIHEFANPGNSDPTLPEKYDQ